MSPLFLSSNRRRASVHRSSHATRREESQQALHSGGGGDDGDGGGIVGGELMRLGVEGWKRNNALCNDALGTSCSSRLSLSRDPLAENKDIYV